ncbi:MAG: hypothetical protein K8R41_13610 [Bacteroidales bacterium]|nr:hypothetical protein [Bacteroidales bacterium]
MSEKLSKILQIVLYVILGVSLIIFVLFYINGESMTDTVLVWAYILLGITILSLLVFPIIHFIKNPKAAVQFLLILAGFAILYGVGYMLASDSIDSNIYEKQMISSNLSQMIGAGLITAYILAGLAVLAILYASVSSAFNRK